MKTQLKRITAALAAALICLPAAAQGIPVGRRPSGGLSDGDGRQVHERHHQAEDRRQGHDQGLHRQPAGRREGHHRAGEDRRARPRPHQRRADEQHLPGNDGADDAVPVQVEGAHAQGARRPDRRPDPEGLRAAGLHRPRVLRFRLAVAVHDQEAGQVAGRRQGHEDPRPAIRPVGGAAAGDGRQCDADSLRRGLHGAQDRRRRRRREQLAVV